jgi:hypothetical protein
MGETITPGAEEAPAAEQVRITKEEAWILELCFVTLCHVADQLREELRQPRPNRRHIQCICDLRGREYLIESLAQALRLYFTKKLGVEVADVTRFDTTNLLSTTIQIGIVENADKIVIAIPTYNIRTLAELMGNLPSCSSVLQEHQAEHAIEEATPLHATPPRQAAEATPSAKGGPQHQQHRPPSPRPSVATNGWVRHPAERTFETWPMPLTTIEMLPILYTLYRLLLQQQTLEADQLNVTIPIPERLQNGASGQLVDYLNTMLTETLAQPEVQATAELEGEIPHQSIRVCLSGLNAGNLIPDLGTRLERTRTSEMESSTRTLRFNEVQLGFIDRSIESMIQTAVKDSGTHTCSINIKAESINIGQGALLYDRGDHQDYVIDATIGLIEVRTLRILDKLPPAVAVNVSIDYAFGTNWSRSTCVHVQLTGDMQLVRAALGIELLPDTFHEQEPIEVSTTRICCQLLETCREGESEFIDMIYPNGAEITAYLISQLNQLQPGLAGYQERGTSLCLIFSPPDRLKISWQGDQREALLSALERYLFGGLCHRIIDACRSPYGIADKAQLTYELPPAFRPDATYWVEEFQAALAAHGLCTSATETQASFTLNTTDPPVLVCDFANTRATLDAVCHVAFAPPSFIAQQEQFLRRLIHNLDFLLQQIQHWRDDISVTISEPSAHHQLYQAFFVSNGFTVGGEWSGAEIELKSWRKLSYIAASKAAFGRLLALKTHYKKQLDM